MGIKIFVLLAMIFMHIVDDYYLQGWLASAKQKSWWEKNANDDLYKHDYIMALFMHSFSWSFMIMLPLAAYAAFTSAKFYPLLYLSNVLIHMCVDNLKANEKKINLVQDQVIHLIQIILTWAMVAFWPIGG
ncbi:DUF3307 domain-containing protein [Lacrimispora sp.]|uniref:DUF3307 domain-containing protein n=1 Tax=Lacrimispora sp. TaxID=2719234 RepID=UPI00345F3418